MARTSPPTDRVVATVSLLATRPDQPLSLAELTRRLGVNKSTGHAILASLTAAGWVLRDPTRKTYRLGPALVALGRTAAASFPALDFARPAMVELSRELGATCAALGVGEGEVTVLDQVDDPRAGAHAFRVGASFPLRPPLGAAVLAWAPDAVRDEWLRQVPADTRAHYAEALVATHDRGFAVEIGSTPVARVRELVTLLGDETSARAALDRLADELATHAEFLALALEADREYAVNVVNAPVFDHTGQVTLVLSLAGFGRPLRGAEALDAGGRLVAATTRLTAALTP
jgi:DNA-binding IclR family transcriptional regulator